jgi:hypothetical protein
MRQQAAIQIGRSRLMFTSNIKPQTSNFLEEDFEELDAPPLSGIGIKNHALGSGAVFRRRLGIDHLQWIPSPDRTRNDSLNVVFVNRRWRGRVFDVFLRGRCLKSLRRSGGG